MKNNFPTVDFFRILTVTLMALILANESFYNFASYPDSFWQPKGILQFLAQSQISETKILFIQFIFWIATLCGLIGLFTRTSLIAIGITTTLLYSLKMSFGYMNHREAGLIVTFFILSAYPVAGKWSLDAKIAKKRFPLSTQETFGLILCLRVLLCLIYFSAAISKLSISGLDWATSATLQYYLLFCDVTMPMTWAQYAWPHAGYHLALITPLTHILAALVIVAELISPLAFVRRLRLPIIGGLVILQFSTFIFLKISFIHLLPLFVAWLPWEKWLHLTKAATK